MAARMVKPLPVVAVDIDEVLCETVAALLDWHNVEYGTCLSVDDFISYHFQHVRGFGDAPMTKTKLLEFFGSPAFEAVRPLKEAGDVLRKHKHSYHFVCVTSRSRFLAPQTASLLSKHFSGIFDDNGSYVPGYRVVMTEAYGDFASPGAVKRTKGQVCKEINAAILIDDMPSYCIEAAACVPLVVLHGAYPWNSGPQAMDLPSTPLPSNVLRTTAWRDIDRILAALTEAKEKGSLVLDQSTPSQQVLDAISSAPIISSMSVQDSMLADRHEGGSSIAC